MCRSERGANAKNKSLPTILEVAGPPGTSFPDVIKILSLVFIEHQKLDHIVTNDRFPSGSRASLSSYFLWES